METALNLLRSEWYWILGGTFVVTMSIGLRDRYPISPHREMLHYVQWALLILYMVHVEAKIPEPHRTAIVVVLLPYAAIWDWTKAVYHTLTNTLPGA